VARLRSVTGSIGRGPCFGGWYPSGEDILVDIPLGLPGPDGTDDDPIDSHTSYLWVQGGLDGRILGALGSNHFVVHVVPGNGLPVQMAFGLTFQ
jgi:hypothetical protein